MRSVPSSPSLLLHNLQTTGTTGYNQFIRLSRQLERLTTPDRLNLALISSALDDLIELKVSLNTHRRQTHPVSILNDIHDFEKRFYIHLIAQLSDYTSDSNLPDANDVIRLAKLFDTCASFLMTDSESLSKIESVDTYLQSFHSITTQLCSKNMLIFLEHSISKSNILSSLLHMTILIQPYYSESKSSNFLDFQNLSCIGTRLGISTFYKSLRETMQSFQTILSNFPQLKFPDLIYEACNIISFSFMFKNPDQAFIYASFSGNKSNKQLLLAIEISQCYHDLSQLKLSHSSYSIRKSSKKLSQSIQRAFADYNNLQNTSLITNSKTAKCLDLCVEDNDFRKRLCEAPEHHLPHSIGGEESKEETNQLETKIDDVDINIQQNEGYTALMVACQNNQPEIATQILNRDDVDVNIQFSAEISNQHRYTPYRLNLPTPELINKKNIAEMDSADSELKPSAFKSKSSNLSLRMSHSRYLILIDFHLHGITSEFLSFISNEFELISENNRSPIPTRLGLFGLSQCLTFPRQYYSPIKASAILINNPSLNLIIDSIINGALQLFRRHNNLYLQFNILKDRSTPSFLYEVCIHIEQLSPYAISLLRFIFLIENQSKFLTECAKKSTGSNSLLLKDNTLAYDSATDGQYVALHDSIRQAALTFPKEQVDLTLPYDIIYKNTTNPSTNFFWNQTEPAFAQLVQYYPKYQSILDEDVQQRDRSDEDLDNLIQILLNFSESFRFIRHNLTLKKILSRYTGAIAHCDSFDSTFKIYHCLLQLRKQAYAESFSNLKNSINTSIESHILPKLISLAKCANDYYVIADIYKHLFNNSLKEFTIMKENGIDVLCNSLKFLQSAVNIEEQRSIMLLEDQLNDYLDIANSVFSLPRLHDQLKTAVFSLFYYDYSDLFKAQQLDLSKLFISFISPLLNEQLTNNRKPYTSSLIKITIDRSLFSIQELDTLEASLVWLYKEYFTIKPLNFHCLKVTFKGEAGLDEGGLKSEFLRLVQEALEHLLKHKPLAELPNEIHALLGTLLGCLIMENHTVSSSIFSQDMLNLSLLSMFNIIPIKEATYLKDILELSRIGHDYIINEADIKKVFGSLLIDLSEQDTLFSDAQSRLWTSPLRNVTKFPTSFTLADFIKYFIISEQDQNFYSGFENVAFNMSTQLKSNPELSSISRQLCQSSIRDLTPFYSPATFPPAILNIKETTFNISDDSPITDELKRTTTLAFLWDFLVSHKQDNANLQKFYRFICGYPKSQVDILICLNHPPEAGSAHPLPVAHTCFTTIDISYTPDYKIFEAGLLKAMLECATFDIR